MVIFTQFSTQAIEWAIFRVNPLRAYILCIYFLKLYNYLNEYYLLVLFDIIDIIVFKL